MVRCDICNGRTYDGDLAAKLILNLSCLYSIWAVVVDDLGKLFDAHGDWL